MRRFSEVWRSTIFQKWVMAVTGILIVLFLIGHLAGNLLIFLGPEDMNAYGVELRHLLHGSAIWVARIGILVAFVLHVRAGIILAAYNRKSAAQRNTQVAHETSTVASRSMILTGLLIAVYVFYHLAHFTWGAVHSSYYHYVDAQGRHDVYRMVVESFQQPLITVLYVLAMIVTAVHMQHAISSAFQTLGVSNARFKPLIKSGSMALTAGLIAGFLSVPVSIILGLVK